MRSLTEKPLEIPENTTSSETISTVAPTAAVPHAETPVETVPPAIMKIEINYAAHFDLLFHVLDYLKVNNDSNCYSPAYIAKMAVEKEKRGVSYDMVPSLDQLAVYYNDNFERLAMLNFLPFVCGDFDEMKAVFTSYPLFTEDDLQYFIQPFIEILNKESSFYFSYWDELHQKNDGFAEQELINEICKYARVFEYYNKSALVILSYSLTQNGRGFGGVENAFSAIVPFGDDIKSMFFQLFHEYTHQFTDALLQNINMDDGSHDLSERIVILADYYLIKAINDEDTAEYLAWLPYENDTLTESRFLSTFDIGDELNLKLNEMLSDIIGRRVPLVK